MNTVIINPSELRANQKKYLDMAENTRVMIKRNDKFIELVVKDNIDSPSPSHDRWFDDPKVIAELGRRIDAVKKGETDFITIDSDKTIWENIL